MTSLEFLTYGLSFTVNLNTGEVLFSFHLGNKKDHKVQEKGLLLLEKYHMNFARYIFQHFTISSLFDKKKTFICF